MAIQNAKGKEETLEADRVLIAAGVVGNVEDLGLETVGVAMDRDRIGSIAPPNQCGWNLRHRRCCGSTLAGACRLAEEYAA